MNELSWGAWAILGISAFLIGLSKTGIPGAAILAIPMVAVVIPARASTGLILPMLIVGDVFAVAYYRRHAVWSHLLRLLPYAVVGVVAGYFALGRVNDNQLRPIIGAIILVMLAINFWRNRRSDEELPVPTAWWFPAILGLLAGITTMMANAAGPVMAIYLLAMRLPKTAFIGTGAWYFMMVNCFKVPFSAHLGLINGPSLLLNAILAPAIVIGALAGIKLADRLPEKAFNAIIQLLAAAGAIRLLV